MKKSVHCVASSYVYKRNTSMFVDNSSSTNLLLQLSFCFEILIFLPLKIYCISDKIRGKAEVGHMHGWGM